MKVSMKDLLRELQRRGDVRFGDNNNKILFKNARRQLRAMDNELENIRKKYEKLLKMTAQGVDQKYKNNFVYDINLIFHEINNIQNKIIELAKRVDLTIQEL